MRCGLLLAILFLPAVAALSAVTHVAAKDGGLGVWPDEGSIGTPIEITSDFWDADVPVAIAVGVSDSVDQEPLRYSEVATLRSNADGTLKTGWVIGDAVGVTLPRAPGWLFVKATSPARSAVANVALTYGGVRPNGAGGVNLTLDAFGQASTQLAFLDWQPANSSFYYITHVGPIDFRQPLNLPIRRLTNGDWDLIVVPLNLLPDVSGAGGPVEIQSTLCASPSIPCDPRPGRLRVVRVPIRDGKIVDVRIVVRAEPGAPPFPSTGDGSARPRTGLPWPTIAGVMVLLVGGLVAMFAARIYGDQSRR